MSNNFLRILTACVVAGGAWQGYAAVADHLVISEVGMNGGPNDVGEYIEIFNPTTGPIDLSHYHLSDFRNYSYLANPTLQNPASSGKLATGTTDNAVRFPTGTILQSGQVAVICGKAGPSTGGTDQSSGFLWSPAVVNTSGGGLANYKAQAGNPLIFEIEGGLPTTPAPPADNPEVPNMVSVSSNTTGDKTWNFTNAAADNGEFVALFWWDGVADLVKDVDIIVYGGSTGASSNSPLMKTTTAPAGNNGATYAADAGSVANLSPGDWDHLERTSIDEAGEPSANGNGITGHDETMEAATTSWRGINGGGWNTGTPPRATPGTTSLEVFSGNLPPAIGLVDRSIQYPSPSDPIMLSAEVTDDGTITSVMFHVNSGSGYVATAGVPNGSGLWTLNIGTFPAGTTVNYYVVATDNNSATSSFPPTAPAATRSFAVSAVPVKPGDLVINEVVYDSVGTDAPSEANQTPHEFTELFNTTNTPLDLTNIQFADGNMQFYTFPPATVIPAKGFVILAIRTSGETPAGFITRYGASPNGAQVFGWASLQLNNSPETLYLRHALNDADFGGTQTYIDRVEYTAVEPWPILTSNSTGQSMELVNPFLDNNDPANWRGDVVQNAPRATPGAINSVYTSANISNVTVNPAFPTNNQAFTVSATIVPVSGTHTITGAQLFVDTGSGFNPVPMPLSGTPTVYTANVTGQPTGTVIRYYISATTSEPFTELLPKAAPTEYLSVVVGSTAIAQGDVIFNEILYDNYDGDAFEFVELFNRTANPVDLSYYVFTDREGGRFVLPVGSIIAANSYMILTQNSFNLRLQYPLPVGIPLLQWPENSILFGNSATGDSISMYHPNQFSPDGSGTPIDSVAFLPLAPWPTWTNAPSNTEVDSPNRTGRSIELTLPNNADRSTNGALWAWTTTVVVDQPDYKVAGTPGLVNSTLSSVSDWTLY